MTNTRMAPSPTGMFHIGSARTALYSWLYAKRHNGKFLLRIEDSDTERSTKWATDMIVDAINWLNLDYYGDAVIQSSRKPFHIKAIEKLISSGFAYYCDCSKEKLNEIKEQQIKNKLPIKYNGCCREKNLQPNSDYVVRFCMPVTGDVVVDDLIRGQVVFENEQLDDFVILRPDGSPTYNLAVVVDDNDMGVTHVLRGDDHLSNTPKQIHLIKALNYSVPKYAHLPMILGEDGKKLSKRHGAVSVLQFKEQGYLRQAVLNYIVRLGWSYKDKEIFTIEEMINLFDLSKVSASPAVFDYAKLNWLNQHYMQELPASEVADAVLDLPFDYKFKKMEKFDLKSACGLIKAKCKNLIELANYFEAIFEEKVKYDKESIDKFVDNDTKILLSNLKNDFLSISVWNNENISITLKTYAKTHKLKFMQLAQPLRIAILGNTSSPAIDIILHIATREVVIAKIDKFLSHLERA